MDDKQTQKSLASNYTYIPEGTHFVVTCRCPGYHDRRARIDAHE